MVMNSSGPIFTVSPVCLSWNSNPRSYSPPCPLKAGTPLPTETPAPVSTHTRFASATRAATAPYPSTLTCPSGLPIYPPCWPICPTSSDISQAELVTRSRRMLRQDSICQDLWCRSCLTWLREVSWVSILVRSSCELALMLSRRYSRSWALDLGGGCIRNSKLQSINILSIQYFRCTITASLYHSLTQCPLFLFLQLTTTHLHKLPTNAAAHTPTATIIPIRHPEFLACTCCTVRHYCRILDQGGHPVQLQMELQHRVSEMQGQLQDWQPQNKHDDIKARMVDSSASSMSSIRARQHQQQVRLWGAGEGTSRMGVAVGGGEVARGCHCIGGYYCIGGCHCIGG